MSENTMTDGSTYQGSVAKQRNIVLYLMENPQSDYFVYNQNNRDFLYSLFRKGEAGTLIYTENDVSRKIDYYAESVHRANTRSRLFTVSLLCDQPMFKDVVDHTVSMANEISAFEFLHEFLAEGEELAYRSSERLVNIVNDIAANNIGITITISVSSTVINPSITHVETEKSLTIGSSSKPFTMVRGDLLTITTGVNNKHIRLTRDGVTTEVNEYMTEGFLSRLQYDFQEKYFLSASFRRDASSRFHKDHRWGNFGSVGLAWEMAKENFMKEISWLDMLKVKVSYGTQGNDNLNFYTSYYPYADLFETSYNSESGAYSIVLYHKGNDDLTWESSKNFNAGFDSILKSRISGTFEYFYRKTSDMLYYKDTPLSAGIVTGVVPVNIGSVANSGIEFSVNATVVKTRDLTWDVNLNLSHYKNEILELDPSVSQYGIKGSYRIYKEGGSLYEAYLRKFAGVDPETGKGLYYQEIKYDDKGNVLAANANEYDHSEVVTTDDFSKATQFECGSTLPDLFGGFGTTLRWRDFDFSAQLAFQLGGKMYDGTYQQMMHTQSNVGHAWHKDILNAWTPENTDTDVPRMDGLASGEWAIGQTAVDRFLISSNYLSLNNVTLGYTLPKSLLGHVGISALRVYVSGENLAVLTKRKGLDPRYSLGIGGYIGGSGASSTMYSALRTIAGGITLSF